MPYCVTFKKLTFTLVLLVENKKMYNEIKQHKIKAESYKMAF